jgi:ElaB/YqjD/DUF883 family membrane-anchored ribosome-binding protein
MAGPSDRGGTHPATSRVGEALGQMKETAQQAASEAAHQAGRAWETVKEGAQQGASAVAERAQDFWTGTQDLIRRYPVASVAIAFGLGCCLAGFFGFGAGWRESMPERMSRYSA